MAEETSRRGFLKQLGLWVGAGVVAGGVAKAALSSGKENPKEKGSEPLALRHPDDILKRKDGQAKSREEQLYDMAVTEGTWSALLTGRNKERLGVLLRQNNLKDTGHRITYNGRDLTADERVAHFAQESSDLRQHAREQVQVAIRQMGLKPEDARKADAQVQKNLEAIWRVVGGKSETEAEKIIAGERHKFQEESQKLGLALGLLRQNQVGNQVQVSGSWTARPGQGVTPNQPDGSQPSPARKPAEKARSNWGVRHGKEFDF